MKQDMDTSVKLMVVVLLGLLGGCAIERAGRPLDVRQQGLPARDEVQADSTPAVTLPTNPVVPQRPESPHVDAGLTTAPVMTKEPADAIRNKPPHPPIVVDVPDSVVKNTPQISKSPQPAVRWSRQLTLTQERFIERNENSLLRVYIDMPKAEVMSIMSDYRAGDWVNPCKQERLMDSSGKVYEVVFYLSRRPVQSRPFNERLMTPVILRDNRVYAIGRYSLKKLRATSHQVDSAAIGCQHV